MKNLRKIVSRAERNSSKKAAVFLSREIGLWKTTIVFLHVVLKKISGQPWSTLPPPENENEVLSRKQAAPVVLLHDALQIHFSHERSLELTSQCVSEGAVLFIKEVIPRIKKVEIAAMDEPARLGFLTDLTKRFFNAEGTEMEINGMESFRFRIPRCRFNDLMKAIDKPQLAPLFCAGDGLFFERYQPEVDFQRPATLSEDNVPCDFRFEWKDKT